AAATAATAVSEVGNSYIKGPDKSMGDAKGGAIYQFNKSNQDFYFTLKAAEKFAVKYSENLIKAEYLDSKKGKSWSWTDIVGDTAGDCSDDLRYAAPWVDNATVPLKVAYSYTVEPASKAYDWATSSGCLKDAREFSERQVKKGYELGKKFAMDKYKEYTTLPQID
ncbi:MAG: hypothetical protein Q8942_03695, partial [Bacillota bacterium]|nr:hypothetical protein [Bacillota bacterium]